MKGLGLLLAFLCAVVVLGDSDNTDYKLKLFGHFDHTMHAPDSVKVIDQSHFISMFHSLGTSSHSFESHWKSKHLPCYNGAPLFFSEIDGNKNNHIEDTEIIYFFNLFDANEDQELTEQEFTTAWSAVFDGYMATHAIHCSSPSSDDDRK